MKNVEGGLSEHFAMVTRARTYNRFLVRLLVVSTLTTTQAMYYLTDHMLVSMRKLSLTSTMA